MLYPIIPMYLQNIGFSIVLIGLLEGLAVTTAGLSKGMFGEWSDRSQQRLPFIRWGYFLSACAKPMLALFPFSAWIFFARTLDRFGKGMRTSPRDALLTLESTPNTRAQVFGFHRSLDTFGAVVGPLLALWFIQLHPDALRSMFFYSFVPGMLAVLLTYMLQERKTVDTIRDPAMKYEDTQNEIRKRPGFFSYFRYWKRAPLSYKRVIVPITFFTLFNSSDMFLLLKVREMTGSAQAPVWAYVAYNIVFAASSYSLGRIADRFGMKRVILFGLLCFCLSYSIITQTHELPIIALVFCIYGLSESSIVGNTKAWLSTMVPSREVGTALGLFASTQSIAVFFASTATGLLWSKFGSTPTFLLSAAGGFIALVWLALSTSNAHVHHTVQSE